MHVWRISEFADLKGIGGLLYQARWHLAGHPVVYTADHPASALCEMIVRTDYDDFPDTYQLLKIDVSESVKIHSPKLPSDWQNDMDVTQAIGTAWLRSNSTALLSVPSVIVPDCNNLLINPLHADATKIKIVNTRQVPIDPRFRNLR